MSLAVVIPPPHPPLAEDRESKAAVVIPAQAGIHLIPPFGKEGQGEILLKIDSFKKSPSIPLFQRGKIRREILASVLLGESA